MRDETGLFGSLALPDLPEEVTFTLDATTYSISLDGAGFSEPFIVSGSHSIIGPYDNYRFMIAQQVRSDGATLTSVVDSVTIIPEPSVYASVLGLLALAFFVCRRRTR